MKAVTISLGILILMAHNAFWRLIPLMEAFFIEPRGRSCVL